MICGASMTCSHSPTHSTTSSCRTTPNRTDDAAEAKWWTTELENRVMDHCLQLHGGYGYMEEYPIARAWRDARVQKIYGGTNEIMKEIVGRSLGF